MAYLTKYSVTLFSRTFWLNLIRAATYPIGKVAESGFTTILCSNKFFYGEIE